MTDREGSRRSEDGDEEDGAEGRPPSISPMMEEEEEGMDEPDDDEASTRGIAPGGEMSDLGSEDEDDEDDEEGEEAEEAEEEVPWEGAMEALDLLQHWRRWRHLRRGGQDEDEGQDEDGEDGDEEEERAPVPLNYDRTQPATHSYLGPDLDAIGGRTFLPAAQRMVLPIFPLNGIVLLPGETLPLRLFSDAYVNLLQRLRDKASGEAADAQNTLGVVNIPRNPRRPQRESRPGQDDLTHRLASMGTTAEIRSIAKQPSADGAVNALTVGRQRFRILRAWMNSAESMIYADVIIIADDEPTTLPRGPFISMGGHYSSTPFRSAEEHDASGEERRPKLSGKIMGSSPHLPGRRVISAGWHPLWVYNLYNASDLAQRAKRMFDELIIQESTSTSSSSSSPPSVASAAKDPVSYSFWLAANLPLDDTVRQELLEINCAADRLRREMEIMKTYNTICCRRCGRIVGSSKEVFCMSLEGPVSAYVNPSGYVHQTITLRKARGLALEGNPSAENSWFPGYAWTIAYCARCFNHMGWRFTAVNPELKPHMFYGLSRASITHAPPPSEE